LIEIINKQLLLQLVGYLFYWQMGFNSVFKGLKPNASCTQLLKCNRVWRVKERWITSRLLSAGYKLSNPW